MEKSKGKHHLPVLGITIGDYNGIGPEVIIKSLMDTRILHLFTPVIFGSGKVIARYKKLLNIEDFSYNQIKQAEQIIHKKINVFTCWEEETEVQEGKETPHAGICAIKAIDQAVEAAKAGWIDAVVTAPVNKNNINAQKPFKGHTEYIGEKLGQKPFMILASDNFKVGMVTTHVPISKVIESIKKETIIQKFVEFEKGLIDTFGITKPKIAILGLNPHAGDNGTLGKEEKEHIIPAIQQLKKDGKLAFGPYPSDGFFGQQSFKRFDGILAMYHDQGLIPFKMMHFADGVNITTGLSIIRTSPDHGTAYDIAGKNRADESSMRAAIYMAIDICKRKKPELYG